MFFYTDTFALPLPPTHRFPLAKYQRLRTALEQSGEIPRELFVEAPAATEDQLLRVHTSEYVRRVAAGELTRDELKRLGFPWSPDLVERSRRSSGATLAAAHVAMSRGLGVNLAGGTHHAFTDRAEGYCVFNDSVIAARDLQARGLTGRVLVIDLDVHQGNGTAKLVADDDSIYAFSIHAERNYPFEKERGDLDIALPDGTGDVEYLAALDRGLDQALQEQRPEFVIYLAGADPYAGDRMGRLALTKAGLAERDRRVFQVCRSRDLPIVVSMAGGYSPEIHEIVDIHRTTVLTGWRLWT